MSLLPSAEARFVVLPSIHKRKAKYAASHAISRQKHTISRFAIHRKDSTHIHMPCPFNRQLEALPTNCLEALALYLSYQVEDEMDLERERERDSYSVTKCVWGGVGWGGGVSFRHVLPSPKSRLSLASTY